MNKAWIVLGIAGMLAVPAAFASNFAEDVTVVTGHTIFVDASGFDPNIALIAGLASSKVVWFNGVIVINNFDQGFIYAVEAGDCDPTKNDPEDFKLVDQDLSFKDPNQQFHVVTHYTYRCPGLLDEGLNLSVDLPAPINASIGLLSPHVYHAWVTPTHNRTFDLAAADFYNFAIGVDTSAFNGDGWMDDNSSRQEDSAHHDGTGGDTTQEIRDGDSYNAGTNGHTYNETDGAHSHNTGTVDLYFSKSDLGGNSTACVTQTCMDRQAAAVPTGA